MDSNDFVYTSKSLLSCSTKLAKLNNNNNNNNNLYLSVKAKIAVTEPLNGDTISEIYIYQYKCKYKSIKKKTKKTYFE